MKKYLFFISTVYLATTSLLLCQGNQPIIPPSTKPIDLPTIVFSPNIYNQIATSAGVTDQSVRNTTAQATSKAFSFATIKDIALIQKVSDKSAAMWAALMSFLNDKKQQQNLYEHITSTLYEYKWRIIFGSLFGSYCYTTYKLKTLEHTLLHSDLWSQWKKTPVSELYMIPDAELSADLLRAIQQKYTTLSALDDFNTPLIKFVHDIQHEEKLLNSYISLVKKLELFRVASYFSINHALIDSIGSRKDKLTYLQSRLWNWVSSYKVSSHLK